MTLLSSYLATYYNSDILEVVLFLRCIYLTYAYLKINLQNVSPPYTLGVEHYLWGNFIPFLGYSSNKGL